MPIRMSIPWPPSVNNLYRTDRASGKRFLTAAGRAYESAVAWQVHLHHVKPIEGAVSVSLDCFPPDNRRRDLDNVLKAVLDSMTKGALWIDDSQVKRLSATMRSPIKSGRVDLTIETMEE